MANLEQLKEKNSKYWRERFELLEDTLHEDVMQIMPDIDRIYKQAQADIEKEIRAWYQRLADNNGVSMTEARKLLTADELKEFHWSVEEYIKRGEENAIDQRWMKQLENASARVHISRLEALKLQTQQSIESVYGNQLDRLDKSMRKLYQDGYYRTAYELQKGFEIGWPIAAVDQNKLDKVIAKPWAPDGKNFSSRIWGNRTKLVNELHTELSRMCLTGAAPDRAIRNIAKKMHTSKYNAGTLVMTEAAAFGSAAQADCFNDLGVEKYEICATLDSQTSEICRGLDGKVYGMKDYEVGVTAPPFHVKCRTCTCPHFDDEFTVGEMRAARGENGKTYYVPADMKYPEWKKQFVSEGKSKNYAKPMDYFIFDSDDVHGDITPESILGELETSTVGRETIEYIKHSGIMPKLEYEKQGHFDRGVQQGDAITIYLSNTKSPRVAAQTVIHEMTHHKYNVGECQWAEAVCFAKEKMHIENRTTLTFAEKRYIIGLVKKAYPHLNWKKGGYRDGQQF